MLKRVLMGLCLLPVLVSGCRAQKAGSGPAVAGSPAAAAAGSSAGISPQLARRIRVLIRARASLPANVDVAVLDRKPSEFAGYDQITVQLTEEGQAPRPLKFLLSKDEKTLLQQTRFDLSQDPLTVTSDAGRPARGATGKAPVTIVGFDDLECPFCARMHAALFPALTQRYGNQIRIVYKDFPLISIHPWALHAAVDADCLALQSDTAYWDYVDHIHASASTIGGEEKSLTAAKIELDKRAREDGSRAHVDLAKLNSCMERQDPAPVNAGLAEGEKLGVNGVPALFVNGEMINGAVPVEYVFRAVDQALRDAGATPPPPYTPPAAKSNAVSSKS